MIKDLIEDLTKYSFSFIVPAVLGLIAIPILTRLFDPEEYGNYTLVTSTVTLLTAVATAGVSSSVVRFYPTYELDNRLREFNGTIIKLMLVTVITISLIFALIIVYSDNHIFSDKLRSLMLIGMLIFIVSSIWGIILTLLRAKRLANLYSAMTIWRSVASLAFGLALVLIFHHGVEGLLWGSFLSVVSTFPLIKKFGFEKPSFSKNDIRSPNTTAMIRYGVPIMVINLLGWIYSSSNRYILQLFGGSQQVGIFSAVDSLSGQIIFLVGSLFLLVQGPLAYSIWEKNGLEASRRFNNKFTRYYLLVGLPATVGLAVMARPIVSVFCAQAYFEGYRIIPFLAVGAFFNGVSNSFTIGFTYHKRSDLLMYCILFASLLNIGMNLLLIPGFGYEGAAMASLITFTAELGIMIIISRRFFVWPFPFDSLLKIGFASTLMGAGIYFIGNFLARPSIFTLILDIFAGTVIYVIILFLVHEPRTEEIEEIKNWAGKIFGHV